MTGASRGIGRATALALARQGADLIVTARTARAIGSLRDEICELGRSCVAVAGDASSPADAADVVNRGTRELGHVDILVNNAGIGLLGPLHEASVAAYQQTMDVNFKSVFLYSRLVVPAMLDRGGDIVNVASISGLKGFAGASLYCASKFATIGLSRSLDLELRPHRIRVCCVCPAGVRTDWAVGTGRTRDEADRDDLLTPETVADSVIFALTQPENARVTEIVVYPMSEEGHQ